MTFGRFGSLNVSQTFQCVICGCRFFPKLAAIVISAYVVTFAQPCADLLLAECNCAAGLAGKVCYHIAAAMACPSVMPSALLPSAMESRQSERERAVRVKPSQYLKATKCGGIDI